VNRLLMCFAALAYLAATAAGAPTFTDQEVAAGYLNPGDSAIVVQEIEVQGDASADTSLYAVTIRNDGTATSSQLSKLEIRDGGDILVSLTDLSGLASGGLTVSMAYTVPAGSTRSLQVLVWAAGVSSVNGGETLQIAVNFYYTVNGEVGATGWIVDGGIEEFAKAGFERVDESELSSIYLNPNDAGTVQVVTWEDHDANASAIYLSRIVIQNLESADQNDVAAVTLNLSVDGTSLAPIVLTDLSTWNTEGIVYEVPRPIVVNDNSRLICEVQVEISATPTENRKIRTKLTLEFLENNQPFSQASGATTTHTIMRSGVEEFRDISRLPQPLVVNSGEVLTQQVLVKDQDANDLGVVIDRIKVWNSETASAEGGELAEIAVYDTRGLLGRVNNPGVLASFHAGGVEIPFSREPVALGDDEQVNLTILYVIGDPIPGHTLQPKAQAWCDEARSYGWSPVAIYPRAVTLYPGGAEIVEELDVRPQTIFSGQRVCVMKALLADLDQNDAPVFINPLVIRNLGTAEPGDVVGLEVTDAEGTVLGQARSLSGFRDSGVTITLTPSAQVPDDGALELWVWITAAAPPRDITGKDVRLGLTLIQSEAGQGYQATVESTSSWPLELNNPPQVDFDWTPAEPRWDEEVTFTPQASDPDGDELVKFEWDFDGDGVVDETTTSAQAVTYTYSDYPEGGRFEVTLTVTDERGLAGSETKTITVQPRPNQPPEADFDWTPKPPEAGEEVTFTATASDPDDPPDEPFTYAWDFGDGTTLPASEDNQQVTHTYAEAGTYTVTLTVTDARGAETEVEKEVTVQEPVNLPPTVTSLTAEPADPEINQEVTFTATATDEDGDEITDWEWDFDGDGTVDSTLPPPVVHTYAQAGVYTVKVRAKDAGGSGEFGPWYSLTLYVRRPGGPPIGTQLAQNPVATQAVIQFFLPQGATDPQLYIFDLLGRPVYHTDAPLGDEFRWNLEDDAGQAVPNGLYFYLVLATHNGRTIRSQVGRILVLR